MKTLAQILPLSAAALCCAAAAHAAVTETANLSVSALVADTCTIDAGTPLAFATIDSSADSNESIPGSITLVCTATKIGATVTLGGGANLSASQRRMSDGAGNYLPYTLFDDSGHTSSIAVDGTIFNGTLTAATPQILPVYGQIPAGNYTSGAYSDTILVTLNY